MVLFELSQCGVGILPAQTSSSSYSSPFLHNISLGCIYFRGILRSRR